MPKKTGEGIEYYTLATSNKGYDGYKDEIRDDPIDGKEGKIIRPADPVCGGYILNYIMEPGRRYQVGTSATSKVFGAMMLLIFSCGSYLRYKDICVIITDSAYGVLEGMALMGLQGISWITSLRISQRQGFLGIKEIQKAGKEKRDANKKKEEKRNADKKKEKKDADKKNSKMEDENKRSMKKDVAAWEKKHEKTRKGTSWM